MNRYRMEYFDADGVITEREVSPIVLLNGGLFRCRCHLRDAIRTFNINRVNKAMCMSTGELFTQDQFRMELLNG